MAVQKTIVLIDDEQMMLNLVRGLLAHQGYQVFSALDGPTGLKLIEKNFPNIVVLDRVMPKMDGLEVLRKIRATPSIAHTPVMMLTGINRKEDIAEVLKVGVQGYVVKPFKPKDFLSQLAKILDADGDREKYYVD